MIMMSALITKAIKMAVKGYVRARRKGSINRDGSVTKGEVVAFGREIVDLLMDEIESFLPSRHGVESEMLSNIRYHISQLEEISRR